MTEPRIGPPIDDLAIVIVSIPNEPHWLRPCLSSILEHAGDIALDVVVADIQPTDGVRKLVEEAFPAFRVVTCENRGFAYANNRGLMSCNARYALFLNPDTEILGGTFEQLLRALDERPEVGLVGVRQVTGDGELFPTIRRFPNALRALGEALGSERWGSAAPWLGERELRLERYEQEVDCDWTSGSFMLARREALESAGYMDERSFLYSEEPDLCLRMKKAGWRIRHLPFMTILHHAGKGGINPKMSAQDAVSRVHYAQKHFSALHRAAYFASLSIRYVLRLLWPGGDREHRRLSHEAARRALRIVLGSKQFPFGPPPMQAVAIRPPQQERVESRLREAAKLPVK
jgi:N-acetylglucosaminyl-diphospho-decaprenol L-rhamnosyltransferase